MSPTVIAVSRCAAAPMTCGNCTLSSLSHADNPWPCPSSLSQAGVVLCIVAGGVFFYLSQ